MRCEWKIRWTFGQSTQCDKEQHVSNVTIQQEPSGLFRSDFEGDPEHRSLLSNGVTRLNWQAGDRREYTGDWPGLCQKLGDGTRAGCTLHTGHHGRCAP